MSEILDHIHHDHKNMACLLDLMDEELQKLAAADDHDYTLLANIVDYFNHYPARYHHPFEDRVFEWIAGERPALQAEIDDLRAEHESQAKLGKDVEMFLKAIRAGHVVPRQRVVDDLGEYIQVQRDHIDKEEGHLLREVEGVLSGMRLSEIPVPDRESLDPLFGKDTDPEFAAIAVALGRSPESSVNETA